jgi:hypothetical protein
MVDCQPAGEEMNNPQAFPRPHSVDDVDSDLSYPAHAGMTLRDYFAAKAMQPLMEKSGGYWAKENLDRYATVAYEMADAMLEAREA